MQLTLIAYFFEADEVEGVRLLSFQQRAFPASAAVQK